MDKNFIHRSLKVATIVTIILSPFLFLYFGTSIALGFMAGAVWNIANVFLLYWILTIAISSIASNNNKMRGAIAGILKFPVLYGTGYIIIRYTNLSPYAIIAGFSLILIIFILRVVGLYFNNFISQEPKSYGKGA